ncbi:MAG: hypothetical protein KAR05_01540 [Candidatus Omnitrophica bacterium]|nr:hypothetical protein [Candidatus Omnitrophota bacterium]
MKQELNDIICNICEDDARYHEDAYEFILEALYYTQRKYHLHKHVTGKELLEGMKILLMERFGPMTLTVLRHWGIKGTEDFGNIVFILVERKVLSKTEEDNIESFKNVYDFEQVFNKGYRRGLNKKISRLR